MPTSDRLLNDASTGLASSTEFTENMQDIEDVILDITGGMVVSGAIPTAPGGLTLRIPASVYDIGVKRSKAQTDVALTNNSTNRVYAVTDPDDAEGISYVVKTDTTVPSRSALRCIAVTSGGSITTITDKPINRKDRVELGLHTITLDQYVNTNLPVNSDLLLKWDFSAKGSFTLQDYQVVIDPDDIDQLPTSTLVFVLPVRNPDHFYVYIQNLSDAAAGGYGTASQIRFTPKLVGRGWAHVSSTGVDTVTASAINYTGDVSTIIQAGTFAARPAATAVPAGTIYFATDKNGGTEYRSNGTTWAQLSASVNSDIAALASLTNNDMFYVAAGIPARLAGPTNDYKVLGSSSGVPTWRDRAKSIGFFVPINGSYPLERWVSWDKFGTAGTSNVASVIDTLYAMPFHPERGWTIDRLAFSVGTLGGAGSVARCGIYKATSDVNIYPDGLTVDAGEQITDVGTGTKSANVNATLDPNFLYWFVFLAGVSAPSIQMHANTAVPNVLGYANTLGGISNCIAVAQAYGALPTTFPSGAVANSLRPAVWCRIAS